jgi:hypothetical protein
MTSKEALEEIKDWVEYFTRLDYVEPIVRGEVQQKFKDAYWGTLKHFEKIEKDLELLEILKYLISSIERSFNLQQFNESGMLGTIIKDYFINNDITGKVKEWLEEK